jgi:hypothetical protein
MAAVAVAVAARVAAVFICWGRQIQPSPGWLQAAQVARAEQAEQAAAVQGALEGEAAPVDQAESRCFLQHRTLR